MIAPPKNNGWPEYYDDRHRQTSLPSSGLAAASRPSAAPMRGNPSDVSGPSVNQRVRNLIGRHSVAAVIAAATLGATMGWIVKRKLK
ncbi:hypothetical protein [Crateriforma conspicua]|uniref:hypothetical protein n=1 Tax=Crateriforma conspicua TaxID=2527996 RepID=UPI00118CB3C5|nr:hypothetical protein [Crateriforma conspicua]QDV63552.1 hypothetical protein Mal65_26960 [Crateriforma conspicua]